MHGNAHKFLFNTAHCVSIFRAGPIFQTTDGRKWVEMSTQVIRVETAIRSVLIAVGLAMVALLIFTHNFIAAGFATLTIGCVCSCILVSACACAQLHCTRAFRVASASGVGMHQQQTYMHRRAWWCSVAALATRSRSASLFSLASV